MIVLTPDTLMAISKILDDGDVASLRKEQGKQRISVFRDQRKIAYQQPLMVAIKEDEEE